MFGAAAMSLSSFCVVTNALRLNLFRLRDASRDKRIRNTLGQAALLSKEEGTEKEETEKETPFIMTKQNKEEKTMTKTMKIEGMMCGHCEANVKKCLEALPEVSEAVVSHESGTAVVTLTAELADDVLRKAVEDQDYKVAGIQ